MKSGSILKRVILGPKEAALLSPAASASSFHVLCCLSPRASPLAMVGCVLMLLRELRLLCINNGCFGG